MPEADHYKFDYKELARLMIKEAGVREGYWGIRLGFAMQATNAGPDEHSLSPAAIVVIRDIGLQRFEKETSLSVDAATVWDDQD